MTDGRFAMLVGPSEFALDHRPAAIPAAGNVRLRVQDCGVCGSDLKMWAGTHAFLQPPLLLGHEIYGRIDAVGEESSLFQVEEDVVVFPAVGCGSCFHCRRDQPQLCAEMRFHGGQLPGGLAEHIVVSEQNLLRVPAGIPEIQRVLIEPLAVGVHAVARAGVASGEAAAVLGAGAIGLFTALIARARGLDVVILEPSARRRERAAMLGFTAVDAGSGSVEQTVAELIRPEGADVVFECVGSAKTIAGALGATRKGGRAVVVGNAPPTMQIDGLALQRGDRSLVGVLMYERTDFIEAMDLLAGGLLEALPESSVVQRFTLDEVGAAFVTSEDGTLNALRAVVQP
ncbi:MAG: alcohol dehydrogenase catalytic domain-containing protein [Actinomycetota bacterium]|nr:alcohol dehydrogenase catalytic domain-containing protein [Actinomycetota bacterium]